MMRIPLTAIFAALVVVAAGSIVTTLYFKSSGAYVINASSLAVGGNITITLNYIPTVISLVSTSTNAIYDIYILGNATFVDNNGVMHSGFIGFNSVPANTQIYLNVADAKNTEIKIVVFRVS
jgi:hypothetical protein